MGYAPVFGQRYRRRMGRIFAKIGCALHMTSSYFARVVLVFCLFATASANAATLAYDFGVRIDSIFDNHDADRAPDILPGLDLGDIVQGRFLITNGAALTFSGPIPDGGDQALYTDPAGFISITLPNLTIFEPLEGSGSITVRDDFRGTNDQFLISDRASLGDNPAIDIDFILSGAATDLFESTEIPAAFDLAAFPNTQFSLSARDLSARACSDATFCQQLIVGEIVELAVAPVPAPASLFGLVIALSAIGALRFRGSGKPANDPSLKW